MVAARTWLVASLLGLKEAAAYVGRSPFLMVSGVQTFPHATDAELAVDDNMDFVNEGLVASAIHDCSYDTYVFVDQPQVGSAEVNGFYAPFLNFLYEKGADSIALSSVRPGGSEAAESPINYVANVCGAKRVDVDLSTGSFEEYTDTAPGLFTLSFPAGSREDLAAHDSVLQSIIGHGVSKNFLVVYRTTPVSSNDSPSDVGDYSFSNDAEGARGPLFVAMSSTKRAPADPDTILTKYQLFSPALFMGIIALLAVSFFVLIAIQWLMELQVSAAAFAKPASNTKKQG